MNILDRRRDQNWYVVESHPASELEAAGALRQAGFGAYVPMQRVERFNRRNTVWVTRSMPLMTGYLFVDVPRMPDSEYWTRDLRPSWMKVAQCDGVKEVLGDVSAKVVEEFMALQLNLAFDDTRAGKIRRKEIGRNQRETAEIVFPTGTQVRTREAFGGMLGVVERVTSRGTLELLVEAMGRSLPFEIGMDNVERIAA